MSNAGIVSVHAQFALGSWPMFSKLKNAVIFFILHRNIKIYIAALRIKSSIKLGNEISSVLFKKYLIHKVCQRRSKFDCFFV